jgi:translation initiation factor 3 subunit B
LVVKVDRYGKKSGEKNNVKYSNLVYNFEIFHMREKNVPLDTVEVKENIQSFSVEPNGHKLIVISGEIMRTNVTFYKLNQGQKPTGKIEILKVMSQPVTSAIWAPNGQYVVLAAMKTSSTPGGQLIFVDTTDMTIMMKQEHPDLSDVEWDPTGRYVASSVSLWSAKRDHSFKIWTFQGSLVFEKNVERLVAFHWRPRPASLLTEEMIKEVRRNRAVWTPKMELRDRIQKTGHTAKQQEHRRKLYDAFQTVRDKNIKRLAIQKAQRLSLRGGLDTDSLFDQHQPSNVGEELVEFLIKTEEVEYKQQ